MKFKMPPKPKISRRTVTALIFVVSAALVVFLMVISAFAIQSVKHFKISGETSYSAEYLIESSGVELGEPLFFKNRVDAEQKLLSEATRLKNVKIKPSFFSTVIIEVEEEQGSYYSMINGEYYLLSKDFRVLEMSESSDAYAKEAVRFSLYGRDIVSALEGEYIEFSDENTKEELFTFLREIESIPFGDHGVSSLGFEDNVWRDAYIVLDGRLKIIFGDLNSVKEKIGFALKFIYESEITYDTAKIIISEGENGYEAYYSEAESVE